MSIKNFNQCMACKSELHADNKIDFGSLPFYYGVKNSEVEFLLKDKKIRAILITCSYCGLIQQPVFEENIDAVNTVYLSLSADASTPMSNDGWGGERAKAFFENIDFLFKPSSVLEVGCQNGYLLYELHQRGAKELVGVEPSPQIPFEKDNFKAKIFTELFDSQRFEGQKFDTIISLWVLEHVKSPVELLRSLSSILCEEGQLIISVPNAEYQINMGDPGLFMHEHLSHFTKNSLEIIFKFSGLEIVNLKETKSDFYLVARKLPVGFNTTKLEITADKDILVNYKHALARALNRFDQKRRSIKRLGLWGACATTANLISMVEMKEHIVFDGDTCKQGKQISGIEGAIIKPTKDNLRKMVDEVCIIPLGFQQEIGNALKDYNFPYFRLFAS